MTQEKKRLGKGIDELIPNVVKEEESTSKVVKEEGKEDVNINEKMYAEKEPTVTIGIRVPISLKRKIDLHDSVRLFLPDTRKISERLRETVEQIILDDQKYVDDVVHAVQSSKKKEQ